MSLQSMPFDGLPVSRWHNGAGRKADIAAGADWHVGFAWLDADAPFSDFTGNDRTITLIDGPGFTLSFPGRAALRVGERFRPTGFDGGWPTHCTLLGGPGVVLNAMTARERCRHRVELLAPSPTRPEIARDALAFFLVVLAGRATVSDSSRSVELGQRDAVRADAPFDVAPSPDAVLCTITISPT